MFFNKKNNVRFALPMLLVIFGMSSAYLTSNSKLAMKAYRRALVPHNWEASSFLPGIIDRKLQAFAKNRRTFILEKGQKNTTLSTGKDLNNATQVILFLPQAFIDSLIQPIPFFFTHKKQELGSFIMGIVGGVDILISYFLLMSFLYFLLKNKNQVLIINISVIIFILMTVIAFSFPNVGTLYRMRYPLYMILIAIGFSHAYDSIPTLKKWFSLKRRPALVVNEPG